MLKNMRFDVKKGINRRGAGSCQHDHHELGKSQLREKMDMFLLAARFMNTTYDNDGNTVAALSEEEQ